MLKQPGWTAGSKTRKLRGFGARNWAKLELFLNTDGLRVDTAKAQGLFRKITRPKGYLQISAVGSCSSGLDLIGGTI